MAKLKHSRNQYTGSVIEALASDWHLFFQSEVDQRNAEAHFEIIHKAYLDRQLSQDQLKTAREQKVITTKEIHDAWASPPLTEEQYQDRLRKGEIPSVEQLNRSSEFMRLQRSFIEKNRLGLNITRQEMDEFEQAWYVQMHRLLQSVDGLFTSANNAGMDLLNIGFAPDVASGDENRASNAGILGCLS